MNCKYKISNFVLIALLFASILSTYATENSTQENSKTRKNNAQTSQNTQNKELPLEITEKDYKRDAILKFNNAVKNWDLKNIDDAIDLWQESIKIDPNLWTSYLGLGQAYENIKEYSKSLEAYQNFLKIAPQNSAQRSSVEETVKYLAHILENGEEVLTGEDYLPLIKTKHGGKRLYARWDLKRPLKLYFYPAQGVENYRREFQDAFLAGAIIWQQALPDLKFDVINSTSFEKLSKTEAKEFEKSAEKSADIKIVFPSKFKVKGDDSNQIAPQIEAQSFPIIQDKTNFRVLGVVMISPYVYHQAQIAIPLEPLSKLKPKEQISKLKIISAREIGHVLGLWGFSPNPGDIMFEGNVKEFKLSDRDVATIKKLYELDPEKEDVLTNL